MSENFLFPTITSLPAGYDCVISLAPATLGARLVSGDGAIDIHFAVFHGGRQEAEQTESVEFADGLVLGQPLKPFVWHDKSPQWAGGYLEIAITARGGARIFDDKRPVSFYAIYSKPGRKSFFSDNAYKFGAPPVIEQIARYGRYVDNYPIVHLDRTRDLGETITFINPYRKALLASIQSFDGRKLDRLRVAAMSVRNVPLAPLLRPEESAWFGQIQITATNRVITYDVKHSLADPAIISDHEHLDPFRGEPTHLPLTRLIRRSVGEAIRRHA
ncbi:MAG: hypothetical protein AB7M05_18100 [Alphaproteobacteria bacterium]